MSRPTSRLSVPSYFGRHVAARRTVRRAVATTDRATLPLPLADVDSRAAPRGPPGSHGLSGSPWEPMLSRLIIDRLRTSHRRTAKCAKPAETARRSGRFADISGRRVVNCAGSEGARMRILHVNKFLYRRGGAEGYMLDVAALQRAAGHEVGLFGMDHPENDAPQPLSDTFPPFVELEPAPSGLAGVRASARMVWSSSSARGIERAIREFRPDLVHCHNIYHQLSPSILRPVARAGIPCVMTLHDYKLACP